jgi:hypothetical protein
LYTGNSLYKGDGTNKGTKESHDFPYLKFNISDNAAFTDESIIYFFNDATTAFDTDYDAYKLFSENQAYPQIYTVSDNVKLSINGLPVPDKITKVPLNLRIGVGKTYTINILDLENLSDCKVTLIHGTERIDLKSNPKYTFFADAGTITNMSIEFDMSLTTDINLPLTDLTKFWYSNGVLSIKIGQDGFEYNSYLTISDLNGKSVLKRSGLSLARGEIIEIPVTLPNGIYITSIFNNSKKLVKKISIVK